MNKVFKVVYNHITKIKSAASELAKGGVQVGVVCATLLPVAGTAFAAELEVGEMNVENYYGGVWAGNQYTSNSSEWHPVYNDITANIDLTQHRVIAADLIIPGENPVNIVTEGASITLKNNNIEHGEIAGFIYDKNAAIPTFGLNDSITSGGYNITLDNITGSATVYGNVIRGAAGDITTATNNIHICNSTLGSLRGSYVAYSGSDGGQINMGGNNIEIHGSQDEYSRPNVYGVDIQLTSTSSNGYVSAIHTGNNNIKIMDGAQINNVSFSNISADGRDADYNPTMKVGVIDLGSSSLLVSNSTVFWIFDDHISNLVDGTIIIGGNDNIVVKNSDIGAGISAGYGDDVIDVSDSRIDYHIDSGPGDDNITFKNSSTQVIFGEGGDDQITIEGSSSVSGTISGNRYKDDGNTPGEINSLVFKNTTFSSQKYTDIYYFAKVDLIEGTQFTLNKDLDLGKYTGFNFDTGSKQEVQLTPVMSIDDTSNLIVTQGSHTLTADLNNNGLVTIGTDADDLGTTFTVAGNLEGNGKFAMRTDIAALKGDLLNITGNVSGNHSLLIADSGNEPKTSEGELTLVTTGGGKGIFTLAGGYVDAGAFRYGLVKSANNWNLALDSLIEPLPVSPETPDVVPEIPGVEPATPVNPEVPSGPIAPPVIKPDNLSKGANAAVGNQAALAVLADAEMGTLVQRMGELRLEEGVNAGVWARGVTRNYNIATRTSRDFDQNISGLELGADKAIALSNGTLYLGGLVGQTSSSQNFNEGVSSDIDSTTLGAYATYFHESGFYVDTILKYNRFGTDTQFNSNVGERIKSSGSTNGYGISVEAGKRFAMSRHTFIEPQTQIYVTHVEGTSYTQNDGLSVQGDNMDIVQGRVGARIGSNVELMNMPLEPYVTASYIAASNNNSSVRVNGYRLDSELPGNRTEVGAGISAQLTPNAKVYAEAQYVDGNNIKSPIGGNVGFRINF
ncbi:autotransporter outer membrane beta-barrel domain-containing protein [Buttiauxella sp. A111]|uniref:autotransporter outer membrane beta-barrel domain-containing protein n=1 Tax=Buttiauxella sp. A111 TaxID=2563088 RepID=UPI0010EC05BE|nr:autotransporter outer membrane beta-barrel domain-containing protein [Buttiauxella sp. A111]GDX04445.1 hypothetical protein BSPA111_06110 [Buttiauxella sp. A111]